MELLLLDNQALRRHYWRKLCEAHAVSLTCLDFLGPQVLEPQKNTRIIILDQSSVPDFKVQAAAILSQTKCDVVAFSFADCSITSAVTLMRQGATWLFDHAVSDRWESEFKELLEIAEAKNELLAKHHLAQECIDSMTQPERDVLTHVLSGLPNKMIARKLEISVRTVEARRARIYRKCNVRSVTELVRFIDGAAALRERFHPLSLDASSSIHEAAAG